MQHNRSGNRRWIVVGILALVVLAFVALRDAGIITVEWQLLSILAAPFTAVAKAIHKTIGTGDTEEALVRQRVAEPRRHDDERYRGVVEASERLDQGVERLRDGMGETDRMRGMSQEALRREAQEYWRSVEAQG